MNWFLKLFRSKPYWVRDGGLRIALLDDLTGGELLDILERMSRGEFGVRQGKRIATREELETEALRRGYYPHTTTVWR